MLEAQLSYTASGNETISHLYEPGNGRITIMFEAFEGPPQIVRLYGKGELAASPLADVLSAHSLFCPR